MIKQVFVIPFHYNYRFFNYQMEDIFQSIKQTGILGKNGYITMAKVYDNRRLCDDKKYNAYNSITYRRVLIFEAMCDPVYSDIDYIPGDRCLVTHGNNNGKYGKIIKHENGKLRVIVDGGDVRLYKKEHINPVKSAVPYSRRIYYPGLPMNKKLHFDGKEFHILNKSCGYNLIYEDEVIQDGIKVPIFDLHSGLNPQAIYTENNDLLYVTDLVYEYRM